uniref:Endonuclease/exonuclease/phosphatase domain-containing protein n=1 Tax=Phlebotomus papatasi TaxID=29031 RepID=A0A1B0D343_PHLPP
MVMTCHSLAKDNVDEINMIGKTKRAVPPEYASTSSLAVCESFVIGDPEAKTLYSPGYPGNYPNKTDCVVVLEEWYDSECEKVVKDQNDARLKLLQRRTRQNEKDYKNKRKESHKLLRKKKRAFQKKQIEDIEATGRNKSEVRSFYKQIRMQRNNYQPRPLTCRDIDGRIISEKEKCMKRWAKYFENLLNIHEVDGEDIEDFTEEDPEEMEEPSIEELQEKTAYLPRKIHLGTWQSPDGATVNQIDHVICDARHGREVLDVRSYRGADVSTDHFLVRVKYRAKIVAETAKEKPQASKWDVGALKQEHVRVTFELEMESQLTQTSFEEGGCVEDCKRNKDHDLYFGSWNVFSLFRPGALNMLIGEFEKYKLSLLAVQEIRWPDEGMRNTRNGHVFYYCGSQNNQHHFGTGFLVHKKLKKSIIGFTPISERMCSIRIRGKFHNLTIFSVHAPTLDKSDEIKEEFYAKLEEEYDRAPKYDAKLILGDFNAKIGKEKPLKPTIGDHSLHEETNDNGY